MSIREALQHLDMAIQRDHTDRVLCAFLQVILAVEIAIQSDAQVIETLLDPVTQQEHATTIAILRDRDMLFFCLCTASGGSHISTHTDPEWPIRWRCRLVSEALEPTKLVKRTHLGINRKFVTTSHDNCAWQ
jgi:hypothetical protein